jgi:hypothetical protein
VCHRATRHSSACASPSLGSTSATRAPLPSPRDTDATRHTHNATDQPHYALATVDQGRRLDEHPPLDSSLEPRPPRTTSRPECRSSGKPGAPSPGTEAEAAPRGPRGRTTRGHQACPLPCSRSLSPPRLPAHLPSSGPVPRCKHVSRRICPRGTPGDGGVHCPRAVAVVTTRPEVASLKLAGWGDTEKTEGQVRARGCMELAAQACYASR